MFLDSLIFYSSKRGILLLGTIPLDQAVHTYVDLHTWSIWNFCLLFHILIVKLFQEIKFKMGVICVSWCEGVGLWSEGMQKCAGQDCSWKAIIFVFLFATHTLFFKINSLPTKVIVSIISYHLIDISNNNQF